MLCERCEGPIELVANLGAMNLVRCAWCKHQQLARPQEARGARWREGMEVERVVAAAGEIDA